MLEGVTNFLKKNKLGLIALVAVCIAAVVLPQLAPTTEGLSLRSMLPTLSAKKTGGTCNCCTCGKISCSKCKRDFKKCCAGAGDVSAQQVLGV